MASMVRTRMWVEAGLAIATGALLVLTLISREWIEEIFGVDPDNGSGALEWLIVAVLAVATLSLSLMARAEWKRSAAATT
jgi:Mg2+/Co2+ transporter CorB